MPFHFHPPARHQPRRPGAPTRIGLPCPGSDWSRSGHAPPRAGIDVITTPGDALAVIDLVVARPLEPETIVIALDTQRRGLGIVVVHNTTSLDSVIDVLDCLVAGPQHLDWAGTIVATVRPADHMHADDADRWLEADALCAANTVQLVEWFLIGGDGTNCPRHLVGDVGRW